MRRFASLILAVTAAAFLGAATEQSASEDIPFEATNLATDTDQIGRMLAPVHINGQGPFQFIVDTGANRSALSSDLVARLGLVQGGSSDVHAFTGMFAAPLTQVASLRTGSVHLRDANMPVIAGAVLAGADGILGVEAMRGRQLIMNFRTGTMEINRGRAGLPAGRWANLGGEMRFGNLVVVDGRIGRVPVKVVIDSGANHSVANTALQRAMRGLRALRTPVTGTRLWSVSRPVVVDQAVLIPRLEFNDATISNVAAFVADVYVFELWGLDNVPAIVIGMDVLQHADTVAIDYEAGSVHLLLTRPSFLRGS